jgi:hypothetical protein
MKNVVAIVTIAILSMITSCSEQKYPDLGNGYSLVSDGMYSLELVNAQNSVMISPHILAYAFDSVFIVASQRPWDIPGVSGLREMTYNQRNEAFEKSTFRQYWIINKREKGEYSLDTLTQLSRYSNVYGPFKKQEYLQKRKELGVMSNS